MNFFTELVIWLAASFVIWQLMYFFLYNTGRVQRWRFRKALDRIFEYCDTHRDSVGLPSSIKFIYKNKKFSVGVFKHDVEYGIYKTYDIYINDDEAATLHCLEHTFLYSYSIRTKNDRHEDEIVKIILAGSKYLKKLKKETTEKKVPFWKENSYFD